MDAGEGETAEESAMVGVATLRLVDYGLGPTSLETLTEPKQIAADWYCQLQYKWPTIS